MVSSFYIRYERWEYMGSGVEIIKGLNKGNLTVYVREVFIKSFTVVLFEIDEDSSSEQDGLETLNTSLVNPITRIINSIIDLKVHNN